MNLEQIIIATDLGVITRNTEVLKTKPVIIDSTSPVIFGKAPWFGFPVNNDHVQIQFLAFRGSRILLILI